MWIRSNAHTSQYAEPGRVCPDQSGAVLSWFATLNRRNASNPWDEHIAENDSIMIRRPSISVDSRRAPSVLSSAALFSAVRGTVYGSPENMSGNQLFPFFVCAVFSSSPTYCSSSSNRCCSANGAWRGLNIVSACWSCQRMGPAQQFSSGSNCGILTFNANNWFNIYLDTWTDSISWTWLWNISNYLQSTVWQNTCRDEATIYGKSSYYLKIPLDSFFVLTQSTGLVSNSIQTVRGCPMAVSLTFELQVLWKYFLHPNIVTFWGTAASLPTSQQTGKPYVGLMLNFARIEACKKQFIPLKDVLSPLDIKLVWC